MIIPSHRSFLVKRHNVVLKVTLRHKRDISIEPYNCSDKDKRLWDVVARTHATVAQTTMEASPEADPYTVLLSLFTNKEWEIINQVELT